MFKFQKCLAHKSFLIITYHTLKTLLKANLKPGDCRKTSQDLCVLTKGATLTEDLPAATSDLLQATD